jgi:hypothetical protein
MANTIALVTQYLKNAENAQALFKKASLTTDLEVAPSLVSFVGADTVKLPKITFGNNTFGTYSRANGHTTKDVNLEWATYQLSQDKGDALRLDSMDDEEGMANGLTSYFNRYVQRIVTPSVDAYRLGKLATGAGTIAYSQTVDAATVLAKMLTAHQALDENEVPSEGRILYITPAVNTIFQTSEDILKYIQVGSWNGDVDLQVRMFNGAKIVVVPATRMPANANFILVQTDSVMGLVKHNPATLHTVIPGFDGVQVDYRMYHDLFVITDRSKGIYLSTTAVDPT